MDETQQYIQEDITSIKLPKNYKILEVIAQGGMGIVYKAKDNLLGRIVAIKLIKNSLAGKKTLQRFERELTISAMLDHPHIIKIYNFGIADKSPFIVMEYIDADPLPEYLKNNKLPLEKKLTLIQKIALALGYIHKKKIIHRDLKPSNIMVKKNGEPVIIDFGISKKMERENKRLTKTGEILGTPEYMAPEQAHGKRRMIDNKSDIYGLGGIFYYLLVQKAPVTGSTTLDVLMNVIAGKIVPPRKHIPEIPSTLEQICMKALEKKQEHRYKDMYQFAKDIDNYRSKKKTLSSNYYHTRMQYKVLRNIVFFLIISITSITFFLFTRSDKYEKEYQRIRNISRTQKIKHSKRSKKNSKR